MVADAMEAELVEAWRAGRTAYPTLDLASEVFGAFARARSAAWAGAPDRAADLFLACACANRVDGAAELFLDRFGERIPMYVGRLASSADQLDEIRQRVVVRCLIGDGEQPVAIHSYSGRGSLEGWVRATAVREALALERSRARHVELHAAYVEDAGTLDRDWLLVQHYRESVNRALCEATRQLPRELRTLLRLHYVHGVTTADLARMFRISRATLVRRLTEARDGLFSRLQGQLHAAAGVPPEDCEQILRLVRSQVDIRLSSLLKESAA